MAIFGPAFRAGSPVVVVLAWAGVLESVTTAYGQEFVTSDRMWANLGVFTSRGTVIVLGTFLLAPRHGALGAAIATAAAHLVALLASARLARTPGTSLEREPSAAARTE
jgi:O-antigen/teichoic acid export membrane protein